MRGRAAGDDVRRRARRARPTTAAADLRRAAGRSAASTSGTTSCRRSSGGCSAGWCCTGSATSTQLRPAAREQPRRSAQPLPGSADPRHALLPRAGVVRRRSATQVFPAIARGPAAGSADPRLGPGLRDRRGSLLGRDRAARSSCRRIIADARVQIFATDVSETRDRARARRHLPGEHRGRRLARAAAALLHASRRRLSRDARRCATSASSRGRTSPAIRRSRKLDLIVCRNVLIYLDAELQQQAAVGVPLRAERRAAS